MIHIIKKKYRLEYKNMERFLQNSNSIINKQNKME
jgi:hypothetical protein